MRPSMATTQAIVGGQAGSAMRPPMSASTVQRRAFNAATVQTQQTGTTRAQTHFIPKRPTTATNNNGITCCSANGRQCSIATADGGTASKEAKATDWRHSHFAAGTIKAAFYYLY